MISNTTKLMLPARQPVGPEAPEDFPIQQGGPVRLKPLADPHPNV